MDRHLYYEINNDIRVHKHDVVALSQSVSQSFRISRVQVETDHPTCHEIHVCIYIESSYVSISWNHSNRSLSN